ncbi:MAG: hypothetical protein H5U26_14435 [Immundisolibacter sp.]|uniref:hypothetical protein n=1 Tax=Immundisolibacter sp. TaxID=1934948 RepID=UPI0019C6186B|nr:hypothetical protein [Immundisolibacter sp.]MBC7163284.1 hypothetical protein [Immundisolibacter sp.]
MTQSMTRSGTGRRAQGARRCGAARLLTGALLAALLAGGTSAAPADPALWAPRMAEAWREMLADARPATDTPALHMPPASGADPAAIEADMARLIAGYAAEPLLAEKAPPAFVQAARLAREAASPASRGVMYDLARDILLTAQILSGKDPDDFAPLRLWAQADPFRAALVPGLGLADSDIAGFERMRALDAQAGLGVLGNEPAAGQVARAWDAQADQPVNRVLPTRLQAWADGVEAAWPRLDAEERAQVLGALTNPRIPPAALLEKVIGTRDVIGWLAAIDVPLTPAEREASPELVHFMQMGAFAGPLKAPLMEIALLRAAQGAAAGAGAAADQLMRLNNWGAMTGEMHSWESYRHMTEGQ